MIGWRSTGEPETYLRGRVPDLNVVFRTDDNGTLMGLVAEGLGVAVVPRLVVNPRNPSLVALPFGTRIPPRDIAIVWHRDRYRSAAAEAFAALACDMGAEYAASGSSTATAASTSRRPSR
jgi:DNA-binding transcriptional LysR family regulator